MTPGSDSEEKTTATKLAKLALFPKAKSAARLRRCRCLLLSYIHIYHLRESEPAERENVANVYTAGSHTTTSDRTISSIHAPATKPDRWTFTVLFICLHAQPAYTSIKSARRLTLQQLSTSKSFFLTCLPFCRCVNNSRRLCQVLMFLLQALWSSNPVLLWMSFSLLEFRAELLSETSFPDWSAHAL